MHIEHRRWPEDARWHDDHAALDLCQLEALQVERGALPGARLFDRGAVLNAANPRLPLLRKDLDVLVLARGRSSAFRRRPCQSPSS